MTDPQMFSVAPSVVTVQCTYDWRFGWSARISVPVFGSDEWHYETYGPCSPSELIDAVAGALGTAVGLSAEQR